MKSILLACALATAATPSLAAQTNDVPQQSAPDAATVAAAGRLLDAMDFNRMMSRTADAMVAQLGPATKAAIEAKTGEPVDDELINRLGKVQEKYLRSQMSSDPKFKQAIALLYARHFNVTDLERLAVLQGDPVMKKWNDIAPALMGDMLPLLVGMIGSDRDAMRAEIEQVVRDYLNETQPAEND